MRADLRGKALRGAGARPSSHPGIDGTDGAGRPVEGGVAARPGPPRTASVLPSTPASQASLAAEPGSVFREETRDQGGVLRRARSKTAPPGRSRHASLKLAEQFLRAPRLTANARPASAGLFEAGEGTRTLDLRLGKPTLYQLSYARAARSLAVSSEAPRAGNGRATFTWKTDRRSSRSSGNSVPGPGKGRLGGPGGGPPRHRSRRGPLPRRLRS